MPKRNGARNDVASATTDEGRRSHGRTTAAAAALIDFLSRVPKVALNCGLPCTLLAPTNRATATTTAAPPAPFRSVFEFEPRPSLTEHYIPEGSREGGRREEGGIYHHVDRDHAMTAAILRSTSSSLLAAKQREEPGEGGPLLLPGWHKFANNKGASSLSTVARTRSGTQLPLIYPCLPLVESRPAPVLIRPTDRPRIGE